MIEMLLLGVGGFLWISFFVTKQLKRYRIRKIGTCVSARVVQVRTWNDAVVREGTSLFPHAVPMVGGWQYEIVAEGTDTRSGSSYIISSGLKKGLPKYARGDYLDAYISPKGNYLDLSR